MIAILSALVLLAAQDSAAEAAQSTAPTAESAAPAGPGIPPGAPSDDYGLVSWCYGTLGGYLDLHDRAMPEVTRIESTYRRPGSSLADDLKVYDDLEKTSRADMKLFASAIEAAEKASLKPISAEGSEAVAKGRSTWAAASAMTDARLAQEWMSWALPARCETTAKSLLQSATLMGPAFNAGGAAQDQAAPDESEAAAPAADEAQTPPAEPAADEPAVESN